MQGARLLPHDHPGRDSSQCSGESCVVHGVHALSARDFPGVALKPFWCSRPWLPISQDCPRPTPHSSMSRPQLPKRCQWHAGLARAAVHGSWSTPTRTLRHSRFWRPERNQSGLTLGCSIRRWGRRQVNTSVSFWKLPGSSGSLDADTPDMAVIEVQRGDRHRNNRSARLDPAREPRGWGADIAVGSAQRFGVPLRIRRPMPVSWPCVKGLERNLPGRLVG